MKVNYCPECGRKLLEGDKFCGGCGHKTIQEEEIVKTAQNHCSSCDYSTIEDEKFCPECGTVLTSVLSEEKIFRSQVQPPRKKKARQVAKTTTTLPVKKKKGGVLHTVRKVALWFFAIVILSIVVLYYIGDSIETTEEQYTDDSIETTEEQYTDDSIESHSEEIFSDLEINDLVSVANTIIPEPFDVIKNSISAEGGVISDDEMSLNIPVGALQNNENIIVKRIQGQLPVGESDSGEAMIEAIPLSTAYDFGPDGILFQKPVTITLKYDEKAIPEEMDEKDVVMIYFDGQKWMKVDGKQDKKNNTISASVNGFPGSILGTAIGMAALGVVSTIAYKLKLHKKAGQFFDDPIKNNEIHKFIEPKHPAVKKYAKKIAILTENGEKIMSFDDPELLAKFFKNNKANDIRIGFKNSSNSYTPLEDKYVSETQLVEPVENYLNKVEQNEDKFGDCIEVANALVSILRSKGYEIKGVSGYLHGKPHAWSEITIGEKVYGIDEYGVITNLAYHKKFVTYPKVGDPYRKEWDERGTRPYGPTLIIVPPSGIIHVDDKKKHTFSVNTFNLPDDAVFSWNLNKLGRSIKSKNKSIRYSFPATGKNALVVTAHWNGQKLSRTYNFKVIGELDRKEHLTQVGINIKYFGRVKYTCDKSKEVKQFEDAIWAGGVFSNKRIDYNTFSTTILDSSGTKKQFRGTTKVELEFRDITKLESLENFSFDYSEIHIDDKDLWKKRVGIGKGIPFTVGKSHYNKRRDEYAMQFIYKGDIRKYIKKLNDISHSYCNNMRLFVEADPLTIELLNFNKEGEIEITLFYKK